MDELDLGAVATAGPVASMDFRKTGRKKGNARGSGYVRHQHDWYQESAACVDAFLDAERITGWTWDPCCGAGNIPDRLAARGIHAIGSDLIDRAGGRFPVANFLDTVPVEVNATNIVCNPPFQLAQRFVEHALRMVPGTVAIVQRLAFLEGQERGRFFAASGLSHVWVHSSRQSIPPGGVAVEAKGGSIAYAWFVWRRTPPRAMWTGGFLP